MREETIHCSPIFTGLTRPPMILGVTADYLFICFMLSYGVFMLSSNPWFCLLYIPLDLFGWIACKFDPNIFRVMMKMTKCPAVRNKKLWGCKSYEPY